MKSPELFQHLEEFKDRINQKSVEWRTDDLKFSAYTNDEIYGEFETDQVTWDIDTPAYS